MKYTSYMKKILSPIRILVGYLSLLALFATFSWSAFSLADWAINLWHFLLLLAASSLVYWLILKFRLSRPTRWEHRVITILILFLLFDPLLPWWVFLLLGGVTELIQRIIRVPTGPLVNPAAMGAVVVSLLGYLPGWWGASFSPRLSLLPGGISIAMLLTLPLAGYVAWKYRKLLIAVVGLSALGITYWLLFQRNPLFLIFEGTLAFFFLVMVVEPKTSPVQRNQQLIYGVAMGILTVVGLKLKLVEPYCIPLIGCNAVFNLYRNLQWVKTKLQVNQNPPSKVETTPQ